MKSQPSSDNLPIFCIFYYIIFKLLYSIVNELNCQFFVLVQFVWYHRKPSIVEEVGA